MKSKPTLAKGVKKLLCWLNGGHLWSDWKTYHIRNDFHLEEKQCIKCKKVVRYHMNLSCAMFPEEIKG